MTVHVMEAPEGEMVSDGALCKDALAKHEVVYHPNSERVGMYSYRCKDCGLSSQSKENVN